MLHVCLQVLACANTSPSNSVKVETQNEKGTLFKKLGGGSAVNAAVASLRTIFQTCNTPVNTHLCCKLPLNTEGSMIRQSNNHHVFEAQDIFYDKMIADPRVNYFFEGIDMKKQRDHQVRLLDTHL